MKRIIVTNNKKVSDRYTGKVEVKMLESNSSLGVLQEGKEIASKGGRLLLDPSRSLGYYKSLLFYMEEDCSGPDEKSLALIDRCIAEISACANGGSSEKEPLIAGILQNKDLNIIKKILN